MAHSQLWSTEVFCWAGQYFLKSMNSLPTFKNRRFYINIQISGFSLIKKRKKENRSDGPSLYSVMAKTRGS